MTDLQWELVNDLYQTWRQEIGDFKMDAHPFESRPERMSAFAAWLSHHLTVDLFVEVASLGDAESNR